MRTRWRWWLVVCMRRIELRFYVIWIRWGRMARARVAWKGEMGHCSKPLGQEWRVQFVQGEAGDYWHRPKRHGYVCRVFVKVGVPARGQEQRVQKVPSKDVSDIGFVLFCTVKLSSVLQKKKVYTWIALFYRFLTFLIYFHMKVSVVARFWNIFNSFGSQAWLDQHGPFDAVVDGANVGLYGQNWDQSVNFHQVNYMNVSGTGIATFYTTVSPIKYIAHVEVTHLQN